MAKVKAKSGLAKANKVLFFIFLALLIATVVIIIFSKPKVAEVPADAAGAATEDVAKIDEFVAGTYGGKDFQSVDDVVKYYVEVFDYNKTLTANYKENGETKTLAHVQRKIRHRRDLVKVELSIGIDFRFPVGIDSARHVEILSQTHIRTRCSCKCPKGGSTQSRNKRGIQKYARKLLFFHIFTPKT